MIRKTVFATLLLVLIPLTAPAQQSETFGPWEIHYHAMNTLLLDPEVAGAHGIRRGGGRAMVSVTVLDTRDEEDHRPSRARVEVSARNLAGQQRTIDMQEVREQEAVYYIGEFRIRGEETLIFNVSVSPEDRSGPPLEFQFQQKLYEQ